jgi:chemotaxis protein histidine kinase CheA
MAEQDLTAETNSSPEQAAAELTESLSNACAAQLDRMQHSMDMSTDEVAEILRITLALHEIILPYEIASLNKAIDKAILLLQSLFNAPQNMTTDSLLSLNELGELIFKFVISPAEDELPSLYTQCSVLLETFSIQTELAQKESVSPDQTQPHANAKSKSASSQGLPTAALAPLDATEKEAFEKYKTRSEDLFVVIFPAGAHNTAAEVTASETFDNLARVAEIILVRAVSSGSLILFAAELPDSALSDIAGVDVTLVSKDDPLSKCGAPWNTLAFSASPKTVAAQQTVAPVQEEDFDTVNLATPVDLSQVDPEMLQDFLANADELMEKLSESVLQLEADPTSKEAIEQIFRAAHTIKGTAGMFGFRAIQRLTHVMENLFDMVRKGEVLATPAHIDAVLFGFDRVKAMFEKLKINASPELGINDALARLNASLRGEALPPKAAPKAQNEDTNSERNEETPVANSASAGSTPPPHQPKTGAPAKKDDSAASLRVDLKRLDSLVNLVGELVIDRTRFAGIEDALRAQGHNNEILHSLSEAVLLFGRHMNEVQSIIMKIRMVPVGNAFTKFTRVVRDLARDCGKEVDLHIEGGEAELDKTLVEEIGDPLIHLIRNSVDHGIESPDERLKAGKSRRGNILLKAHQDSNMIIITIKDDGRGLQVEKLRKKAIQNGLIKENESLTDKETFNLIFEAGFSTAEKVTNISGRGVGMDVVKKNITKLKGVIELDSQIAKGTTTTIKLPLTLAIIPSLMIDVSGESYAIPLVNVVESLRIAPEDIQRVGAVDFVKLREKAMPLLYMSKMFALDGEGSQTGYRSESALPARVPHSSNPNSPSSEEAKTHTPTVSHLSNVKRAKMNRMIFVVVGVGERRVGVVVDKLLGQQEIVIKSLGHILPKPQGIAGGCVLGNGKVALVLDVGEIIDEMGRGRVKGVYHES